MRSKNVRLEACVPCVRACLLALCRAHTCRLQNFPVGRSIGRSHVFLTSFRDMYEMKKARVLEFPRRDQTRQTPRHRFRLVIAMSREFAKAIARLFSDINCRVAWRGIGKCDWSRVTSVTVRIRVFVVCFRVWPGVDFPSFGAF